MQKHSNHTKPCILQTTYTQIIISLILQHIQLFLATSLNIDNTTLTKEAEVLPHFVLCILVS